MFRPFNDRQYLMTQTIGLSKEFRQIDFLVFSHIDYIPILHVGVYASHLPDTLTSWTPRGNIIY
jgi:hypothetical protein